MTDDPHNKPPEPDDSPTEDAETDPDPEAAAKAEMRQLAEQAKGPR